jgi:hypothetical protein
MVDQNIPLKWKKKNKRKIPMLFSWQLWLDIMIPRLSQKAVKMLVLELRQISIYIKIMAPKCSLGMEFWEIRRTISYGILVPFPNPAMSFQPSLHYEGEITYKIILALLRRFTYKMAPKVSLFLLPCVWGIYFPPLS